MAFSVFPSGYSVPPFSRRHGEVQRVPPAAAAVAAATAVSAPAMAEEGGGLLDFGKARLWKPRRYPWEIHGKSMGNPWEIQGKSMGNPWDHHHV